MKIRWVTGFVSVLLWCATCAAQSRFNNQIEPGRTTRTEVDSLLGQPSNTANANTFLYAPPAGASRLLVKYRPGSNVVDLIQVDFAKTYSRSSMVNSLKLSDRADASAIRDNHLLEYFGGNHLLVMVYATTDAASGVGVLGYYSRELYESVVRNLQPASASNAPANAAHPSLTARSGRALPSDRDTEFKVKLLSPVNTQSNKKGDKVTAQVLEPEQFRGDVVEGTVRDVKSGNKVAGKSVLNFGFDTLNHGSQRIAVRANVKSISNSKGQPEVDEEGQVIRKKNNIGKIAAGTAVGALIGGLAGGGKGAAIGAGIGAGSSLILVEVATEGPNISFAAGSELVMTVRQSDDARD